MRINGLRINGLRATGLRINGVRINGVRATGVSAAARAAGPPRAVRFTGRGWGVLAAGVALLAGGAGFGYPELAAIGAAAVLAVLASLGAGLLPLPLAARRTLTRDRVMRGDPCPVALAVTNTGRWGWLSATGVDSCGARRVPVPLPRLRAGATRTAGYDVPTGRRGVVPLGPLRIGRDDPLDLVRAARVFGEPATVRVYPYLHPLAAVPAGAARDLDGLLERVPHGSVTFDALREYVPGDDLRHVHWRTTAHAGELMVRERVDTSRPRLVVLLDDRAGVHDADSFEHACEAAGSVLAAAVNAEVSARLLTAGGTDVPAPPRSTAYLDALAEASVWTPPADRPDGGWRSMAVTLRHLPDADTLVCLTGAASAADLGALAALRGGYLAVVVGMFGPRPPALPHARGFRVLGAADAAGFARMWDALWAR